NAPAQHRGQGLAGRLRYRLLRPQPPAPGAGRRRQDRPQLHLRRAARPGRPRPDHRDHRHGAFARHYRDRRGRGEGRPVRDPARARLRPGAGLLDRASGRRRGLRRPAGLTRLPVRGGCFPVQAHWRKIRPVLRTADHSRFRRNVLSSRRHGPEPPVPSSTTGASMTFEMLGLSPALLRALAENDFSTPTPIQAQAIPLVLGGHDVLGAAQTGTGKTAAFGLPLLQRLAKQTPPKGPRKPRALVLVPTRELAVQVADSLKTYGRHLHLNVTTVFGG